MDMSIHWFTVINNIETVSLVTVCDVISFSSNYELGLNKLVDFHHQGKLDVSHY